LVYKTSGNVFHDFPEAKVPSPLSDYVVVSGHFADFPGAKKKDKV